MLTFQYEDCRPNVLTIWKDKYQLAVTANLIFGNACLVQSNILLLFNVRLSNELELYRAPCIKTQKSGGVII